MRMSSSLICEQSHDSVITTISKEFAETIAKSSSNLLTIDLRLLKKIFGKFGFVTGFRKGMSKR